MIFITVYHDACIENLLLRLISFTFQIKLKAPLRQMSGFTLSPPILAAILYNATYLSFSAFPPPPPPPPPDNYCTASKSQNVLQSIKSVSLSMKRGRHILGDCLELAHNHFLWFKYKYFLI